MNQFTIINSLEAAADAYIAMTEDNEQKDHLFVAVEEWLTASYEKDGCTEDEITHMDIKAMAESYINVRRGSR